MATVNFLSNEGSLDDSFNELWSRIGPYANWTLESRVEYVLNYFLDVNNAIVYDYQNGGFLNYGLLPDGKLKIDLDGFQIWYTGTFSTAGSTVTSVDILDGTGGYLNYSGNIIFAGLPLFSTLKQDSTLSLLGRVEPNGTEGSTIFVNAILTPQGFTQGEVNSMIYQFVDSDGRAVRDYTGGGNLIFNNQSGVMDVLSGSFTESSLDTRNYPITTPNEYLDYITVSSAQIPLTATTATFDILSGNDTVTLTGRVGSTAYTSTGNDSVEGSAHADTIYVEAGNDYVTPNGGNDLVYGGTGLDTVILRGSFSEYTISVKPSETTAFSTIRDLRTGRDETDQTQHVERLQFADQNLALDITGVAAEAYRIYKAAFNREPDLPGLGFWISKMDAGTTVAQAAGGFIGSTEFQNLYGPNPTNEQFVDLLYLNVLNRQPDASGYAYWNSVMGGGLSRADVLAYFSESAENINNVAPLIADGIQYIPYNA